MNTSTQLAIQWPNPSDTFSLLLIIGEYIVQHAIAQLFGAYIQRPPKTSVSNTIFALLTGSLRQCNLEKWPAVD